MRQETHRGIVRDATLEDLPSIVAIYNEAIPGRRAVADTEPITVERRREWFDAHEPIRRPLWVLEQNGSVIAWVSIQSFANSAPFAHTAEVSVYVSTTNQGQGVGKHLLSMLIQACPSLGVDVLLGYTFAHNNAVIRLNHALGFAVWAHLRAVARLEGVERDLLIFGLRTSSYAPSDQKLASDFQIQALHVGAHYERTLQREARRLDERAPVEFAITARHIRRRVQPGNVVADVGVGVAHYAELLARRDCELQLVDVSRGMLNETRSRLQKRSLGDRIRGEHLTSATNLGPILDNSCDAVLMLGPLYHLLGNNERSAAIAEAARVLRPGGWLFAAGINRLAYFRDLLRSEPATVQERVQHHAQFLLDGRLTPTHAAEIGFAHLTTVAEFRRLFERHFVEDALIGVEAFASTCQQEFRGLSPENRDAWLELIEATGKTEEGLAGSDHFLFVGRKRVV